MTDRTNSPQTRIMELRDAIDTIDCELVDLLNERARLALAIRALKPDANLSLYDPKREEEIFAHLAARNEGPLYDENLREIYESLLHVMKELRS